MADPKAPPPVRKKGPGVLLVLTAVVLVLVSAYVVYAFVPILPCPPCQGTGALNAIPEGASTVCEPCKGTGILKQVYNDPKTGKIGMLGGECPPCNGSGSLKSGQAGRPAGECLSCRGKGRITLHEKFNLVPLDPSKLPVPDPRK